MQNRIIALFATGLSLVGLYLVLDRYTGTTEIISSLAEGTAGVYRTLQGR
jgi:hypothetical protein